MLEKFLILEDQVKIVKTIFFLDSGSHLSEQLRSLLLLKNIFCGKCMIGKSNKRLNPDDIRERLHNFLLKFEDPNMQAMLEEPYDRLGHLKYQIQMQKVANDELKRIDIHVEDLEQAFRKQEERVILDGVRINTKRYVDIFYGIVDHILPKRNIPTNPEQELRNQLEYALAKQRQQNFKHTQQGALAQNQQIPLKMSRKYCLFITYRDRKPHYVKAISQLNSTMIGSLTVIKGIVIRTDEVKPRLCFGTYTCDVCGCENYQEILNDKYTPLQFCLSQKCKENNVNGKLTFLPKHSHFVPSQQITIQEVPEQLKQGNIPRNMKISLSESNVKAVHPGDIIQIQGVVLSKRKEKTKFDEDLIFEGSMQAFKVSNYKKRYVDMQITEHDKEQIQKARESMSEEDLFKKLSTSIAPQIYGHEYVKKALLLLLAGGVTAVTNDNMKIRGEINIMLCGDPGVAKSQLLKYISYLAPRGVYTTGKGSSDVGLTAAIRIDNNTKDVSLEAGALVLADMGVCCIDQFDKMNDHDKTAIHEVMEQQTVSIAKAGLTTTLNARTSVLAAANPLYSRYNPNETAEKNINLPAALLSRFDLIFILLDNQDSERDLELARHIAKVHQYKNVPVKLDHFNIKFVKNYIALSKDFEPKISPKLTSLLIEKYVKRRAYYADRTKQGQRYITTRNLLALIRLCQARARLRFSNDISEDDIIECEDLMMESQKNATFIEEKERREVKDDITSIYSLIKDIFDYKNEQNPVIEIDKLLQRVQAKGFSKDALDQTITHYSHMNVLMLNKDGNLMLVE